jgi:transposase
MSSGLLRQALYGLNNATTVTRRGHRWTDDEVIQLLIAVRKKQTVKEIAITHQRTVTAINLKLRSLAAEYYYYEHRSIQEIQKITGLTQSDVKNAIELHKDKQQNQEEDKEQEQQQEKTQEEDKEQEKTQEKDQSPTQEKEQPQKQPTMKELMSVLLNIHNKIKALEQPEPSMNDLMNIANDIQTRLNNL